MPTGQVITTVDSHTEGNPTRVVVAGVEPIPGSTVLEKREYLRLHRDHLRELLVHEPRGGGLMCAVLLLESCDPMADFSVIFLEQQEYTPMSGHSVMGVATTLIETGMVKPTGARTQIVIDTPAGLVTSWVDTSGGTAGAVTLQLPPSFVAAERVPLADGTVFADIAYGGDYYACVEVADRGLRLTRDNAEPILQAAAPIARSLSELRFPHPTRTYIDRVYYVLFWERVDDASHKIRNVVVCPPGIIDRSPCGTGTGSLLALLHRRSAIMVGEVLHNEGILGTEFTGVIDRVQTLDGADAVIPYVTGSAYLTGFNQFVVDDRDPFPSGFVLDSQ
jgi:proline racemase